MMITRQMRCAAALAAAVTLPVAAAGTAQAQSTVVTLRSLDGTTQIQGELLDFDGSIYSIRTGLGTLAINALQVSCDGDACPRDELYGAEFGIFGSSTLADALMPSLVEGYAFSLDADLEREIGAIDNESMLRIRAADGREMAAIAVKAHGSAASFDGLASGEAMIGMSSRSAREEDIAKLVAAGIGDLRDGPDEQVVALDGLAVIVHPSNPLRALSVTQIADIFAGDITNWSQVGGLDLDINVYAGSDGSGSFDTFASLVLEPNGVSVSPRVQRIEDDALLSDTVSNDLAGIGFTSFAYQRAAKTLALRLDCGIVIEPTTFATKTEEYPLSRRLYLYQNPNGAPAHARNLVRFASSDDAQPLIEEAGFISLQPETRTLAQEGGRIIYTMTSEEEFSLPLMREMLGELNTAERISLSFRFTPGSSRLDPASLRNVVRLAQKIERGDYIGRELILIGFTDSIGQFDLNRQLGIRRAEGVREELVAILGQDALNRTPVIVQGYGELTPVGCNDSFEGRFANRRVEVWVRDPRG